MSFAARSSILRLFVASTRSANVKRSGGGGPGRASSVSFSSLESSGFVGWEALYVLILPASWINSFVTKRWQFSLSQASHPAYQPVTWSSPRTALCESLRTSIPPLMSLFGILFLFCFFLCRLLTWLSASSSALPSSSVKSSVHCLFDVCSMLLSRMLISSSIATTSIFGWMAGIPEATRTGLGTAATMGAWEPAPAGPNAPNWARTAVTMSGVNWGTSSRAWCWTGKRSILGGIEGIPGHGWKGQKRGKRVGLAWLYIPWRI